MADESIFTPELKAKVNAAPSPAALIAIAEEYDIPLSPEHAELLYIELHPEAAPASEDDE